MENKVICIEGQDGCGKTTQSQLLAKWLKEQNYKTLLSREPGGAFIAEKIRDIIINNNNIDNNATLLMLYAARRENWVKCIKPAIMSNAYVVLDRFIISSIVYQALMQTDSSPEEQVNYIYQLHNDFIENFYPRITFILISSVDNIQYSLEHSKKDRNILDNSNSISTLQKHYSNIHNYYNHDIKYIYTNNRNIQDIHQEIIQYLYEQKIV